MNMMNEVYIG